MGLVTQIWAFLLGFKADQPCYNGAATHLRPKKQHLKVNSFSQYD